jgi:alanine racemase
VWAEIDLEAVAHNVGVMRRISAPARLCAVVKADAYGHGDVDVARAAMEAGASWLAVALVEEGMRLRQAGISAPVLLLSEPPLDAMSDTVGARLTPTLYTLEGVAALSDAAAALRGTADGPVAVHVKVDTGMHRVGVNPEGAADLVAAVTAAEHLHLQGLWTHLAVADERSDDAVSFTAGQLRRFDEVRAELARGGVVPDLLHAANSAGALAHPAARLDMVRCGITLYGEPPAPALAPMLASAGSELRPVLSLRARVAMVRDLRAGERLSYGRVAALPHDARVATIPIGYADGVPRQLFSGGGTVLIGGRRCPLAGTVTMDQIIVDCGPGAAVAPGDDVVLIGRQGVEQLSAGDWAETIGTISYEVLCGIGARVPRLVIGERGPAATPVAAAAGEEGS